jgi:arylsulfatase A-like enzyme
MLRRLYQWLTSNLVEDDLRAIALAETLLLFLWTLKLALVGWYVGVKGIHPLQDAPAGSAFLIGASDLALCALVAGIYLAIFKLSRLLPGPIAWPFRHVVPLVIHSAVVVFSVVSFQVTQIYRYPLEIDLVRSAADPMIIRSSLVAYAGALPLSLIVLGVCVVPLLGRAMEKTVSRFRTRSRAGLWVPLYCVTGLVFAIWVMALRGVNTYGVKQNAVLYFIAHYDRPIEPVDAPTRIRELNPEVAARDAELTSAKSIYLNGQTLSRDYAIRARGEDYNVIMIQMESTSAIRCDAQTTPNLMRLAQHGVCFTNHSTSYTQTTKATYDLYYSDYLVEMGCVARQIYQRRLPRKSLAEVFKAADYDTALVSSSFLSYDDLRYFFQDKGFDQITDSSQIWGGKGELPWSWGVLEDQAIDSLESWIASRNGHKFFALYSNTFPHHPYYCPLDHKPFPDNTWLGRYRDSLFYADQCIGHLVDWLTEKKLIDHTIIVLVGDHGETVSTYPVGHGLALTTEEIKVPFIISNPAIFPEAQRSRIFSNHLDVAPTILGLLNLSAPSEWLGRDLTRKTIEPRLLFLCQQNCRQLAVIDNGLLFAYDEKRNRGTLYQMRDKLIPLPSNDPRMKLAAQYDGLPQLYEKWALWRHLSRAMESTYPNSTIASARKSNVQ